METLRKNTKHCSVGEYDFDVAINRQIVLDGFKQFPNLWKVVAHNSKYSGNVDSLEDISAFTDLLEANDIIEEVTPKYVAYVLPKMLENGYGRIINVGSVAGVYGNANMVHYSATKGALISMTKALAKEVTDKGVLVNCVSPGSVSPSGNKDMNYFENSELSFMGRTGTDMENANLICFLASDEASYISGQNIQIDGCRKKQ